MVQKLLSYLNNKFYYLCVLLFLNLSIQAQSNASYELLKLMDEVSINSRNNTIVHLIIKADQKQVDRLKLEGLFEVKYSVSDIHAIKIPFSSLEGLVNASGIEKIEVHDIKIIPSDTKALRQMRVDSVHGGLGELETNYTGKGVVFGMIDSGIDPSSPEFQNEDGSSRILKFWDQNNDSNTFETYGYGVLYTNEDIDNGSVDHYQDTVYNGHGTAVASVAVGGGMLHDSIRGVAPDADIMVVGINNSVLDYTNRIPSLLQIVDAIHFIFSEADKLGKSAVINISLGGLEGSHDGQDLPTKMIEGLLDEKLGRALVVAAGNAGTVKHHIRFDLNNERKFSWFRPMVSNSDVCKRDSGMYMSFYMDRTDASSIDFRIALELTEPCCELYGNTGFINIANVSGGVETKEVSLSNGEEAVIKYYTEDIGSTKALFIEIDTDVEDYLCRVSFEGKGIVDGWSGALDERSCNSEYVSTPLLIGRKDEIENYENFVQADKEQNIGTAYACSDRVITVGAYYVRTSFTDIDSVNRSFQLNPLEKADFSSVGPTRDGRIKPDILGPGSRILANNASQILEDKLANSRSTVYVSGEHVITDGTSFASPAVAGVVALFFEKYPDAGYGDIKRILTTTSIQDEGNEYPNSALGYGRVNANQMLLYEGDVSIEEKELSQHLFKIYPNPSMNNFIIDLTSVTNDKAFLISIYNLLGEQVYFNKTNQLYHKVNIETSGLYYVLIELSDGSRLEQKHLVLRP